MSWSSSWGAGLAAWRVPAISSYGLTSGRFGKRVGKESRRVMAARGSAPARVGPRDMDTPIGRPTRDHLSPDVIDLELLFVRTFRRFPRDSEQRAAERIQVVRAGLTEPADSVADSRQPLRIVNCGRNEHNRWVLPADSAI